MGVSAVGRMRYDPKMSVPYRFPSAADCDQAMKCWGATDACCALAAFLRISMREVRPLLHGFYESRQLTSSGIDCVLEDVECRHQKLSGTRERPLALSDAFVGGDGVAGQVRLVRASVAGREAAGKAA